MRAQSREIAGFAGSSGFAGLETRTVNGTLGRQPPDGEDELYEPRASCASSPLFGKPRGFEGSGTAGCWALGHGSCRTPLRLGGTYETHMKPDELRRRRICPSCPRRLKSGRCGRREEDRTGNAQRDARKRRKERRKEREEHGRPVPDLSPDTSSRSNVESIEEPTHRQPPTSTESPCLCPSRTSSLRRPHRPNRAQRPLPSSPLPRRFPTTTPSMPASSVKPRLFATRCSVRGTNPLRHSLHSV